MAPLSRVGDLERLANGRSKSGQRMLATDTPTTQIYVRPFPNVNDGKWQVSTDHGFDPLWSPNGRELFFNTLAGMMVTRVETEPTFNPGMPELFPFRPGTPVGGTEFDIAPDGERFLMLEPIADESSSATQINVILNWFNELERLVPVN